ncbi:MAG: TonB-dependent receptor [Fidelibacterota bacterium]|nr:MAG: TonB-dependent receptor [Candidatus Neomarinimicrobiota bacterium]
MIPTSNLAKLGLISFFAVHLLAGATGTISGTVRDADTGAPLPGANVVLEGTALGAATNRDGLFSISKIPTGEFTLHISYIGYDSQTLPVTIEENQAVALNIELSFAVIQGREVVVTALLEGQAQAINQQLASNTIVNIVSADKIMELPDQNAAESVGRLPGISIMRDAGEGQKVVVRGLSPRFNTITVNGQRIPSTDPEDRSVDLSMIAPDVLAGIEVFKSLTPDMDGDAVGGAVNFVTRKAPEGFRTNTRLQTGYNGHEEEYGQYKGSVSLSDRYWKNKIGVMLTGSLQRANRSSDYMDAGYFISGEKEDGTANVLIDGLNLGDRFEIRKRYSASLMLDLGLENGEILFNSFWGQTDRDELRRRRRYNLGAFRQERTLRDRQLETRLSANSISGQHNLLPKSLNIDLRWQASYSKTAQETPFSHTVRFYELSGFNADSLIEDQGPEFIPQAAYSREDETFFKYSVVEQEWINDDNLTAQLDLKMPFALGKGIAGYFKMGGKFRDKNRDRETSEFTTSHFGVVEALPAKYPDRWNLDSEGRITLGNYIDPDYTAGDFLGGRYEFGPGLDVDNLNDFLHTYRYEYFNDDPSDTLYEYEMDVLIDSYEAGEKITAGYVMMELNLGPRLMFLPGVRYEQTINRYKTIHALPVTTDDEERMLLRGVIDTTGQQTNEELLPMLHIRYRPTTWSDIRLAATRTLTRPDYHNLVPYRSFKEEGTLLVQGNPGLRPVKSWNYDAFFSIYNRLGLFTVGVFAKEVEDVDYIRTRRVSAEEKVEYGLEKLHTIIQPENVDDITQVRGYEIELQTNLKSLPSPLDGIVIYANYSRVFSETYYPFLLVERGPPPFFRSIFIDTVRVAPMIGQADYIANLAIGYEKGGFSGRISMIYQGEILRNVDVREELDEYDNDFVRWDIAMQQELFEGFSLYLDLNNITDRSEGAYLWKKDRPFTTSKELFGWTADLGIRYKF